MNMCYDGALVMPSSYAIMDEEEMTYVEGGGTTTYKLTAYQAMKYCEGMAKYYAGVSGISLLSTGLTLGVGGVLSGLSGMALSCWLGAYNDACDIYSDYGRNKKTKVVVKTILAVTTGVTCKVA